MDELLLVIINGAPGAGKTILGKKLAKQLRSPFLNRASLKHLDLDDQ
jgi:adenylate kinase family enzyme